METPIVSGVARRQALKEASNAVVAAASNAEEAAIPAKLAEAKSAPKNATHPVGVTRNEQRRMERDVAAKQAAAEEQVISRPVSVAIEQPGESNPPLAKLNAYATAAHASLTDEARSVSNEIAKVTFGAFMHPDRLKHLKHKRARQLADRMRG